MTEDFGKMIDAANENKNFQMPQIDLTEYPSLKCDKCGNVAFTPAMIIKKIPGVLLGNASKTQLMPDQILVCSKCGTILKKDRDYYKLTDDGKDTVKEKQESASGIII